MPPPVRTPHRHRTVVSTIVVALVATVFGFVPGAAAEDVPATAVSPVAVPFIGEYPVWCTSGNPAPNDLCGSHHRTPAIDVGMEIGREIRAAGDGFVIEVESGCGTAWCRGGAGNFVSIQHADGTISRYLHLDQVLVSADEPVTTGQIVGLSGATGQLTNPHLHYDEHFPAGTRTPFGPWLACVDGEVVEYPAALGHESWLDVPFGTLLVNDGYDCLADVRLVPDAPLGYSGPDTVAVAMAPARFGHTAELETVVIVGTAESSTVTSIVPDSLIRMPMAAGATYAFRVRVLVGSSWTPWSDPTVVDPVTTSPGPTCRGLYASTAAGTSGIDVLIGTDGPDTITAGAGNDIICAQGGNDVVDAGDGNDFVDAGAGHDTVVAGPGRDRVIGGLGHDTIDSGVGRDRVAGGAGTDTVVGGAGSDLLLGGVGSDEVRGEDGNDRVRGGGGDDLLRGGGGNDRIFGNDGTDHIDGGAGTDWCVTGEGTAERCEP